MALKSTLPVKAVQVYGDKGDGNLISIKTDSEGNLKISGAQISVQFDGENWYYNSHLTTPLTTTFTEFAFNFTTRAITIINDSPLHYIEFSFDGTNVHGRLKAGEIFIIDRIAKSKIYLRGEAGNEEYRLWAW